MIPKADLIPGAYYDGMFYGGRIARWNGKVFITSRNGTLMALPHPSDALTSFKPVSLVDWGVDFIPLEIP